MYEALGRPLGPETAANPANDPDCPGQGAIQHFEHGRLYWTPETDVVVLPADLVATAASSVGQPIRSDLAMDQLVVPLMKHHDALLLACVGDRKAKS